jgi:hypothetical protein
VPGVGSARFSAIESKTENAFGIEMRDLLQVARVERLPFEEIHRRDI